MANFEWYRSFVSIYKHSSVTEAAKTRIMTQPAMSQHLASLEAEVGEPLFTRTARKMIPTERGKELYTQLAPLVESLEEATLSFRAAASPTLPIVKIATAPEIFRERITPVLRDFHMRIYASYGVASHIFDLLIEDKVDLIVTSQKFTVPGVEYVHYLEEEFVVVSPYDFIEPEIESPKQLEEWLAAQPWLSYGLELPIIRRFWRENFQRRPQMKPEHILPDLHIILSAIEQGAGVSLLPTYMLSNALQGNKVKIICKSLKVTNDLYLAYQMKNRNMPNVRMMVEALKIPEN
ncbi:HTH-type transcriptional activator CmpR [Paenibacillus allorhizoplanae]|uniref:HTH-type transcriptional activator CmpR n=1 Tax=Paenibacillus allorhizoplanae TaxID=2905648 RepID=A0ABM9C4F0_9BACL|nr:LysR family transcriptional regulator [Paenibacillus allorhizoplanae]CAH1202173.1 HTH-type transcriptional activator CmpR [Paenibacillus allorhizoplanae]